MNFGNICLLENDQKQTNNNNKTPPTPQKLIIWGHLRLHFSEPKIYFKGSTSRAHFVSGLEFQNPFLLSFKKKFT